MDNTTRQQQSSSVRRLKVYSKTIFRRSRFQHRSYTIRLPEIRLMGKWLEEAGFSRGHMLEVTCEQEQLTIRVSKAATDQ